MIDNFFKNFYRQCKEPTRFGFYRVAADTVDAVLPVIKDLLKDPLANADMLAAHKVDTANTGNRQKQRISNKKTMTTNPSKRQKKWKRKRN